VSELDKETPKQRQGPYMGLKTTDDYDDDDDDDDDLLKYHMLRDKPLNIFVGVNVSTPPPCAIE
jgi:hypothetical protein